MRLTGLASDLNDSRRIACLMTPPGQSSSSWYLIHEPQEFPREHAPHMCVAAAFRRALPARRVRSRLRTVGGDARFPVLPEDRQERSGPFQGSACAISPNGSNGRSGEPRRSTAISAALSGNPGSLKAFKEPFYCSAPQFRNAITRRANSFMVCRRHLAHVAAFRTRTASGSSWSSPRCPSAAAARNRRTMPENS